MICSKQALKHAEVNKRLRGFGVAIGEILVFPINLRRRPNNTVARTTGFHERRTCGAEIK